MVPAVAGPVGGGRPAVDGGGFGAGAGAVGMYPTLPTRAIGFLGTLASLGALYGYDKFSPEILGLLKSKGLIDPNYGSVMR